MAFLAGEFLFVPSERIFFIDWTIGRQNLEIGSRPIFVDQIIFGFEQEYIVHALEKNPYTYVYMILFMPEYTYILIVACTAFPYQIKIIVVD